MVVVKAAIFSILCVVLAHAAAPLSDTDWYDLENGGPFYSAPIGVIVSDVLQNPNLPCFPDNDIPYGYTLPYETCTPTGVSQQKCLAVYAGDATAVHSNTPLFDGFVNFQKDGTPAPWSHFVSKGYPNVYPNIPKSPDTGTVNLVAWAHGAYSWAGDYPWCFVSAGWGAVCVTPYMVNGAFNTTNLASLFPVYQPGGDQYLISQAAQMQQCIDWARSLNNTAGPLEGQVGSLALTTGHSMGGAWAKDAADGNERLRIPPVQGVVAISPLDPSDWTKEDYELAVTSVPQTIWGATNYIGLMGQYRPVAKNNDFRVVSLTMYNTAHQQVAAFIEAEGALAVQSDLVSAGSFSFSSSGVKGFNAWALSDILGHKMAGQSQQLASPLRVHRIIAYMLGNSISAYLRGNLTALRLIQADNLAAYIGDEGFVRGYASCGEWRWDPHDGVQTCMNLINGFDTYTVSYGPSSVDANLEVNKRPAGVPCTVRDANRCKYWWRLTCTGCTIQPPEPQSTAELFQCMEHSSRHSEVVRIKQYLDSIGVPY